MVVSPCQVEWAGIREPLDFTVGTELGDEILERSFRGGMIVLLNDS